MSENRKLKVKKIYFLNGFKKCCPLRIKRRLYDLGFLIGEKIRVERKSLFGKVYLIEISGYMISIQKNILNYLILEEVNG